jgi:hypothetical protein
MLRRKRTNQPQIGREVFGTGICKAEVTTRLCWNATTGHTVTATHSATIILRAGATSASGIAADGARASAGDREVAYLLHNRLVNDSRFVIGEQDDRGVFALVREPGDMVLSAGG